MRPAATRARPAALAVACGAAVAALAVVTPTASAGAATGAVDDRPEPAVIVLDVSTSMGEDAGAGQTRLDAARAAVRTVAVGLARDALLGLRVFGHEGGDGLAADCRATELVQPIGPRDVGALESAMAELAPTGRTPLGHTLAQVAGDFDEPGGRVVLLSDGEDSCGPHGGPDPCEAAADLAADERAPTVDTVGYHISEQGRRQLECIAEATGGTYRDVTAADELAGALRLPRPAGQPVDGGATAARAAPVTPGRWTDTVPAGGERWYAVDVPARSLLRVSATLAGDPHTPLSPASAAELEVRGDDPLGSIRCGADRRDGVGAQARRLHVDGLGSGGEGPCGGEGRYLVGLGVNGVVDRGDLDGVETPTVDVELAIDVAPDPDAAAPTPQPAGTETASTEAPAPPTPTAPEPGAAPAGALVGTGALAALVGLGAGAVIAERLGP